MIKNLRALFALVLLASSSFAQDFEVAIDASSTSVCGDSQVNLTALPVAVGGGIGDEQTQGERPTITITFAEEISSQDFSIHKADLKYDKSFAYSIQIDDGLTHIIDIAYPLFEGGNLDGEQVPGLASTDGCGNDVNFKMATAHYSWNNYNQEDMHDPDNGYNDLGDNGTITWEEMIELYQNGWGIYNHGFHDNGTEGGLQYTIMRNHSFTKRNTHPEVAGGINMNLFVIPGSAVEMGDVALENGYNQVLSANYSGGVYYDVNNDNYYNVEMTRQFGLSTILPTVEALADAAQNGTKGMATTGMHQLSMPDFREAVEEIEQTYGKSGSDDIWFTTSEEVIQYLYVRDHIEIQESVSGNTVTLTLQNVLPTDLRFYALSLLIDSDVEITNVEIQNGFNHSYNTSYGDSTLINLNWDESLYQTPEELAEEAISATEESQDSYDALIAMDYLEMIEDTVTRNYFKAQLCAIPGISLPDGYCSGTSSYTFEWSANGELISNEPGIVVSPGTTTEYIATISTESSSASESVEISVSTPPSVAASAPSQACSNNAIQLSAEADNYSGFQWSGTGDGSFGNQNQLESTYIAGEQDINEGQVKLYASASSEGCTTAIDSVTIGFNPLPEISMDNEATTCEDEAYDIEISTENTSTVTWSSSGDGFFNSTSGTSTTYMPGTSDISNGAVTLTATANSGSTCSYTTTGDLLLEVVSNPAANAGENAQVCQSVSNITLEGEAEHFSSASWSTSGSGSFESNGLIAVYVPSEEDKISGQVTFSLNVQPLAPCSSDASDEKTISFAMPPEVDAGNDTTACFGIPFSLNGTATGEGSFYWTTTGNGTFVNSQALSTYYNFGTYFQENHEVTLTLHGTVTGECEDENISSITLTQPEVPEISAGDDGEMCVSYPSYQLQGSISDTTAEFYWITQGDGYFSDTTILNPLYFPGPEELAQGNAYPGMRLAGGGECYNTVSDDFMLLSIVPEPDASITSDQIICMDESALLTANATNYDSLSWTTAGDGSFGNPDHLQTEYFPGSSDENNQQVKVYFEAFSTLSCEATAIDSAYVFIYDLLLADAGDDDTVCPGGNTFTCDPTVNNASQVSWSSSGSGSFYNPEIPGATYFISDEDRSNGEVTLYLEATSQTTCNQFVTDSLKLFFPASPTVDAGEDQTICSSTLVELSATSEGSSGIFWQTSGDGFFSDANSLETFYTPGSNDISSGSVTLNVLATSAGPCQIQTSDFLTVTIEEPQNVQITASPESITAGDTVELTANPSENHLFSWQLINGSNNLTTYSGPNTTYPSVLADTLQPVQITVFASGTGVCQSTSTDTVSIEVVSPNAIYAGEDLTACSSDTEIELSADYSGSDAVVWTSSGDGSFEDNQALSTIYYPGSDDIQNGQVSLTIASLINPGYVSDEIDVFFNLPVTLVLTDNLYGCSDDTVFFSAEASNYSSVIWETIGDGVFLDPDNISTGYIPGPTDGQQGETTITATAQPLEGCTEEASESAQLLLSPSAVVDAGADQIICGGEPVMLDQATASNYSSLQWQSSGNGNFADEHALSTVYYPSGDDYSSGQISLTLTASSSGYCQSQSQSSLLVSFEPSPEIISTVADSSCYGSEVNISAEANNYSLINWISSGNGSFNDNTGITASYIPSQDEVEQGLAEIMAVASGTGNCSWQQDTAVALIHIIAEPLVDAGEDLLSCGAESVYVFGQIENGATETIQWSSSGDGSFENENLLNTIYHPGPQDISDGTVNLILQAQPEAPCGDVFTDEAVLTINNPPQAPGMPSGSAEVCNGTNEVLLEINAVEGATEYQWVLLTPSAGEFDPDSTGTSNVLYLDEDFTGYYQVRVRAGNSCGMSGFSDSFEGAVRQKPDIEFAAYPSTVVCQGEIIELEGSFAYDSLYQWSPGNYPDTAVIMVDSSGHVEGNKTMALTATNTYGCQSTDSINLHFTVCTHIPARHENSFKVWPVPSDNEVFISYHKEADIEIFNRQGKLVLKRYYDFSKKGVLKLKLRNLPTGVYFIKLKNKMAVLSRKIVLVN